MCREWSEETLTPKWHDCHQEPEEMKKDSSLESSKGMWPSGYLDFGPLASQPVRGYISLI